MKRLPPGFRGGPPGPAPRRKPGAPQEQYGEFRASLLYCPTCRKATPTRERLLLVLPTGNLYEYRCVQCGTSTGSKTDTGNGEPTLVVP
jgi:hypothetical protein